MALYCSSGSPLGGKVLQLYFTEGVPFCPMTFTPLFRDEPDLFGECLAANFKQVPHDHHRTVNKGHGRIEIRDCWTITDPEF